MRAIKEIFIHCSASEWGNTLVIEDWHKRRGFTDIGYHYVILNGRPHDIDNFFSFLDGQIESARNPSRAGAHVSGKNKSSLGVCLIGNKDFTDKQFLSLKALIDWHISQLRIKIEDVLGHCEDGVTKKTCPNIPMDALRAYLKNEISLNTLQHFVKGEKDDSYFSTDRGGN